MFKIIKLMVNEGLIEKNSVSALMKNGPIQEVAFSDLVSKATVGIDEIEAFLAKQIGQGLIPCTQLENLDAINSNNILEMLAKELGAEYVDIDNVSIDMNLISTIQEEHLLKYRIIPVSRNNSKVMIIFADPLDIEAKDFVRRAFPNEEIGIMIASSASIYSYLRMLEMNKSIKNLIKDIRRDLDGSFSDGDTIDNSSAVSKLIKIILESAIHSGASDIHIEATEKNCVVRNRIDGILVQSFSFGKDIYSPLSSRMKLLSDLDIAEKRKPQDGRFSTSVSNKEFDFRVSTLPTIYGESIVLRILDKSKAMIRLEDAGMSKFCYDRFSESIKAPYGIVLVTGPTGSGKTTTLYGALNAIKDIKDKIITVEDPVEYQMSGLQQVLVRPNVGLTFASALKSILRQDPDKIMIGEIRDKETLRIAIQAALTGHLVLSTLHTNDAISAVARILDMGIEEYLVSGALVAIQAQRLVRKICPHCKKTTILSKALLEGVKDYLPENPTFYVGAGCKKCGHSGYSGREMISEVLTVSENISRLIARNATKEELTKQAMEEGFINMFEDGVSKALEGKTTIEEIYRVARL